MFSLSAALLATAGDIIAWLKTGAADKEGKRGVLAMDTSAAPLPIVAVEDGVRRTLAIVFLINDDGEDTALLPPPPLVLLLLL